MLQFWNSGILEILYCDIHGISIEDFFTPGRLNFGGYRILEFQTPRTLELWNSWTL